MNYKKPEEMTITELVAHMKKHGGQLHLKANPRSKARVKWEWH